MKVIEWLKPVWRALLGRTRVRIRVRVRNQTWVLTVGPEHHMVDPVQRGKRFELELDSDKSARLVVEQQANPQVVDPDIETCERKPIEGARQMLLDSPMVSGVGEDGEPTFERLQDVAGLDAQSPMRYLSPEQQVDPDLHEQLLQEDALQRDKKRKPRDS